MKKIWKHIGFAICLSVMFIMSGVLTACGGNGHIHDLTLMSAQEATCTQNGNTAYFKCATCEKLFSDAEAQNEITLESVTLQKLGHDVKHCEGKEANCTEAGNIDGYACSRCYTCFTDETGTTESETDFVIEALGHDYPMAFTEAKAPTVNAEGNVAYYHCSKCGKNFADGYGDCELESTTIERLIPIAEVTVALKGYKEGQEIDLNNKTVSFTGDYSLSVSGTVQSGSVTLQNVYAINYAVFCDGYTGTIAFEAEKTSYELRLEYPFATNTSNSATGDSVVDFSHMNDVNHTIKLRDSWGITTKNYTEAKLNLPSEVADAKYATVSFTLKYGEFRFDSVARFGVKMADNKGVFVGVFNKRELQVCVFGRDKADDTFDGFDSKNNAYAADVSKALGDGMQVRVVRAGDKIRMFVNLNGEWTEFINYQGVATCGANAKTDIRFLILAHEWEFSNIEYSVMEHKTANPATTSAAGNLEYYKGGDMFFKPDGTLTTEDAVTLPMLTAVNATITLKSYKDGVETPISGNVQFVNAANGINTSVTYASGNATTTTDFYAITYQVTYGDYVGSVTVSSEQAEYNVVLQYKYATDTSASNTGASSVDLSKMNDANHTIKLSDNWGNTTANYTEVKLNLPDNIKNAKNTAVTFTLKFVDGDIDTWANLARFGVKMADGKGIFSYVNYDKTHVTANAFNDPANMFNGESNTDCNVSAFLSALKGDGLQVRVIRIGSTIRMLVKLDDAWVQFGATATCDANAETDIRLLIMAFDWEFSHIEYSLLEHVDATPATTESVGYLEHYKVGDTYFTSNGILTTQDAVTLPMLLTVNATFTFKGYKEGAETNVAGNVRFENAENNKEFTLEIANGSATKKVEALTYQLTCGDYIGTVTVIEAQTEYTVVLQYKYAEVTHTHTDSTGKTSESDLSKMNDTNHSITLNDSCNFEGTANYTEVKLNLPADVTNAKYTTVSFTLKYLDGSFDNLARVGVKMTGENGMFLTVWGPSTTENYLHVCVFGRDAQNDMFNGWDNANNNRVEAVRAALSGNGMQIRMVRANDKIRMFVYLNSEWIELLNNNNVATCDENADTDIRLLILKHKWEFSNIEYSVMEHKEANPATTSAAGNLEHYKVGNMFFKLDGTLTTEDAVTLPMLTTIDATINLKGYKDGTETPITGEVKFVNVENDKNFAVTFTNGTATQTFDALTYTVTYGDYFGTVSIALNTTEYTVVLQYKYATETGVSNTGASSVDLSKMNDANHTIKLSDSGWSGTQNYTEVQLNLPDAIKSAKNSTVSFTLKSADADFNANANLCRFGVKMSGGKGIFAYVNYEKIFVEACAFNNPNNMFDGGGAQTCDQNAFMNAIKGAGLQVRVIRIGTTIRMLVKLNDSWVQLGATATCEADAETDIRLLIMKFEWEFSNIEYSVMEHVDARAATTEKDGCLEHYKVGEMYFNTDSTLTTEEAVTVKYGVFAVSTGSHSNTGNSSVSVNNDNHTITLSDTWGGATANYTEAQLNLSEEMKNAKNVMVSFTLKCTNNYDKNLGRFGIKMAQEKGVFAFIGNDAEIVAAAINPNNAFDGWIGQSGNKDVMATAIQGEGLQVRAIRIGTHIRMLVKLGDTWVQFTPDVICEESAETDIRFLILSGTWEVSNVECSALEHVEANAETNVTEHYKATDMYFTADGTLTTKETVAPEQ